MILRAWNVDSLLSLTKLTNAFYLSQYSFDEGRIVELNNQAKHFVTNASADTHRVHLIFDYVDDHPIKQRFLLQPGEKVYQTRRSIDLEREVQDAEVERRKAPTFVIIGAQVQLCLLLSCFCFVLFVCLLFVEHPVLIDPRTLFHVGCL